MHPYIWYFMTAWEKWNRLKIELNFCSLNWPLKEECMSPCYDIDDTCQNSKPINGTTKFVGLTLVYLWKVQIKYC